MAKIQNWRGETIEVARSKGGTLVVINPHDNLIKSNISPWPPPEIIQKLYQSYQVRAFDEVARREVTRVLGYYSDLQSIHSEDAITWSVFGTLAHADQEIRCSYVGSLMSLLGVPSSPITNANIWLWRRVPHPDTLVSGGPEIDFGIQTDNAVVFGEAKWLSKIGAAQGKDRDKDQLVLRNEFFEKYGKRIWGEVAHYVVLCLSLSGDVVQNQETPLGNTTLYQRNMTWAAACGIKDHPLKGELEKYLQWKVAHSKPKGLPVEDNMTPTIPTLGPPWKRTTFSYTGDTHTGVTFNFTGNPFVSTEFFTAILDEFQGQTIPGGFSMTEPTPGGLGEWVQSNSARLNPIRLSPRHASFISAILVHEGLITSSLRGNAVYLHFN